MYERLYKMPSNRCMSKCMKINPLFAHTHNTIHGKAVIKLQRYSINCYIKANYNHCNDSEERPNT